MRPEIVYEDGLRRTAMQSEFEGVRMKMARATIERFAELLEKQGRVSQTPFARKLTSAAAALKHKHHASRDYDQIKTLANFLQSAAQTVFLAETLGLGPWESDDGGR